jgi:hypothetical protein
MEVVGMYAYANIGLYQREQIHQEWNVLDDAFSHKTTFFWKYQFATDQQLRNNTKWPFLVQSQETKMKGTMNCFDPCEVFHFIFAPQLWCI